MELIDPYTININNDNNDTFYLFAITELSSIGY